MLYFVQGESLAFPLRLACVLLSQLFLDLVVCIRCVEYALLILEYWADAPEIQRSADLYEDLIKCCVGDAMGEVCIFCDPLLMVQCNQHVFIHVSGYAYSICILRFV